MKKVQKPYKIYLSPPHMAGEERRFIDEAFKANYIAPSGPQITGFEKDIQNYLNDRVKVACLNSGTSAIHLALKLVGVKKGDEVICQSNTFAATAFPILYQSAIPIFIDSETDTYNLSPRLLKKAIKERSEVGKKPAAIIAVHLYGMPFKVDEIKKIALDFKIPLIEDGAEALGSEYKGKKCGTFGDFSVISFNGNKIITTSAGGALVCRSEHAKNKTIQLATQANTGNNEYHHEEVGYNYRISNIAAAIGRGQMLSLDKFVQKRRSNFQNYKEGLKSIKEIKFLEEPEGFLSNRWLTTIITESQRIRNALMKFLSDKNIECRPMWKPLHLQPVFEDYPAYINGCSEQLSENGLCLPSGSNLNEADMDRIIKIIREFYSA
ncbi:MAG: DegT/DnrJ/EryC1/StrS family aminotransferase [Flavobacteriaceae bacterium]|nr:DegT/DnrJ/EryC1/StrS family aminotransferase [Flavobacteriaceae bacterium]